MNITFCAELAFFKYFHVLLTTPLDPNAYALLGLTKSHLIPALETNLPSL